MPKGKKLPTKYVVTYDDNYGDPYKTFDTDEQLNSWLQRQDYVNNVDRDSIRVYEIKSVSKADVKVEVTLTKLQ